MHRRPVGWIAAALVTASLAHAQSDPLLVRSNGTQALTRQVLPALVAKGGGIRKGISRLALSSRTTTVLGVGVRTESWLEDVLFELPVASDDVTAAFAPGSTNRALLGANAHFDGARLRMTYRVRTAPVNPLIALPEEIALDESYAVDVRGVRVDLRLRLRPHSGFLDVEEVELFTPQVDTVMVADSAGLTDLANGVLGWGLLLGVRFEGCETVNRCFTRVANSILNEQSNLRAQLLPHLKQSLRAVHSLQFLDQQLSFVEDAKLDLDASLHAIGSKVDFATTGWNVSLVGSPGGRVPGLAWSFAARPPEDPSASPAQGDLDAFIPYTLVDKAIYEALQVGLLEPVDVNLTQTPSPAIKAQRFTLQVTPTAVPRAKNDPAKPGLLVVEFPARLDDVQIGTLRIPTSPSGSQPIVKPVAVSDASARAMLETQIESNARGALRVRLTAIRLEDIAGSIRVGGGGAAPLSQHRVALEQALGALIAKEKPTIDLVSGTVSLVSPIGVKVRSVQLGAHYVRVGLGIAVQ
jgi:hypothetical protein